MSRQVRSIVLITILFSLLFSVSADAKKRSKAERKAIATSVLWSHEFPGSIMMLEMTANGLLHAVALDGKNKKSPRSRYLVDYSGNVFWKGPAHTTALLGDAPHAVMLEVGGPGFIMSAVANSGARVWQYPMPGVPASTIAIPESNELVMVIMPYDWAIDSSKPYPANMVRLDLTTGKERWTTPIGNLKGSLESFGGEMAISADNVWWAAGGMAVKVGVAKGDVQWQSQMKNARGGGSAWVFGVNGAAVLRGNSVAFFDDASGLRWQRVFDNAENPNGIAWTTSGIAASLSGKKNVVLAVLDFGTGTSKWQTNTKHKVKKFGLPPRGIATHGNVVAQTAGSYLVGHDLTSGSELYRVKIKKNVFLSLDEIRQEQDNVILIGYKGATAYDISNGAEVWSHLNFVDPIEEVRKLKAAAMSVAMSNMQGSAPGSQAAWKAHRDGSMSYTQAAQTAAFHTQMQSMARREKDKKMAKTWGTLWEMEQQIVNRSLGPNYAEFYGHRGGSMMLLKVVDDLDGVLLDLRTGALTAGGGKRARNGCIPQLLIDPTRRKMVETYRQVSFVCQDEDTIEMYDFPK